MPISLFGRNTRGPANVIEKGWQLYAKPTTLEPIGTIFRIDDDGRRFMVQQVDVPVEEGEEAAARVQERVQAHVGFFARFLGLDSYGGEVGGSNVATFEFEIVNPMRQFAFDDAMDTALEPALAALKYRADNRYFVIREVRSATAMTYRLTKAQMAEIGGELSLAVAVGAGAKLGAGDGGLYEINQTFPKRMRVMYLAEEIAPVTAGLAGAEPVLGRLPVTEPLVWTEG